MTSAELLNKYIGDQKITEISEPDAAGKVNVNLENGQKLFILLSVVSGWATENVKDLTTLRELKIVPIVVEIITTLSNHQLKKADFDYLAMKVGETLRQAEKQAEDILWAKDKEEITINDIEKVISKNV